MQKKNSIYYVLDIGWVFSHYLNSIIMNKNYLQKEADGYPLNSNNLNIDPFIIQSVLAEVYTVSTPQCGRVEKA